MALNMKSENNLKLHLLTALSVIIVLAFDVFFALQKEGYHMDEILSYELSNSEFTPWITPTQPEGRLEKYYRNEIHDDRFSRTVSNLLTQVYDIAVRRGGSVAASYTADVYENPQWMTEDDITKYVTFYGSDSVIALSAYYNSTTDNHPPLYFMLINILSALWSLFAYGRLSVWPGIILNMMFMAGSLLVICAFFKNIAGRPYLGPLASIVYGLSPAGLNTVLLIRMYCMTSFFCLAFTYVLFLKLQHEDEPRYKNRLLTLITVLGFLTQYFVCIYYFFLTLCVLVYLIRMKKKGVLKGTVKSLVISAVIGLITYPFVYHDLFGTTIGNSVMENMSGISGYFEKLVLFGGIIAKECAGCTVSLFVMIAVMIIALIISVKTGKVKVWAVSPALSAAMYYLVVSKIAPYTVDRYLMPVLGVVIICFVIAVSFVIRQLTDKFISSEKSRNTIGACLGVLICGVCTAFVFMNDPGYLYKGYTAQLKISEVYESLDAVVVYQGTSFYQNVPELMNYDNCLLVNKDELPVYDENLASHDKIIVIEGAGVNRDEVLTTLGDMYGYSSVAVLMEDGVFGDRVCLLSK